MRRKLERRWWSCVAAVLVCGCGFAAARAAHGAGGDEDTLSAAVCSIVYPVDQTPSERGYHYLFYGNGFFINEQGYLVTAAHVLSQIRGGQPYILLRPPAGPARFVRATLMAVDVDHDVAVLKATPNPFEGGYRVGYLRLSTAWPAPGGALLTASLHPSDPLHAYTQDGFVDDRTAGQVFDFQFSQLYRGHSEAELFLFNPQVRRGQSGAPVISAETQEVVGFVEGQWLRSTLVQLATAEDGNTPGVGAAVAVHYVIALLLQKGIAWHPAPEAARATGGSTSGNEAYTPPAPLSLVACPFPSQSIFGGEVVLDAQVDARGRLSDTATVRGDSPFLDNALQATRTWSFHPARQGDEPVASRAGIVFLFVQSHEPARAAHAETHDEPLAGATDRGALPMDPIEPQFPETTARDGYAIFSGRVGPQGELETLEVLQDSESLAPAVEAAVRRWHFVPGKRAGTNSGSTAIIAVIFRYTGSQRPASPSQP